MRDDHLRKVLIFTAALGGGHEAAGRCIRDELEQAGHVVVMADGLRIMSRSLDRLLVEGYSMQGRNNQKSLGTVYAITSRRASVAVVKSLVSSPFASRLLQVLQKEQPDLVVSTYPLVTSALGSLCKNGRLEIPVVAVIPDYGVHPLWVSSDVTLHLVVSRHSARLVEHAGGSSSLVRMPVARGFQTPLARDEARTILKVPQEAFMVLVVGGALGIGSLEEATQCSVETGAYSVVVTGKNAGLKTRLEAKFASVPNVRVLGWRKDMPALMAAADCLIQNAGGMTCLEAITMRLPILMFNPVPGHGEFNAEIMGQAGAARWIRTAEDLKDVLRSAVQCRISLPIPHMESSAPSVREVLEALMENTAGWHTRATSSLNGASPRMAVEGSEALTMAASLSKPNPTPPALPRNPR